MPWLAVNVSAGVSSPPSRRARRAFVASSAGTGLHLRGRAGLHRVMSATASAEGSTAGPSSADLIVRVPHAEEDGHAAEAARPFFGSYYAPGVPSVLLRRPNQRRPTAYWMSSWY